MSTIKTTNNVQSLGIPGAVLTVNSNTTFNGGLTVTNGELTVTNGMTTMQSLAVAGLTTTGYLDVTGSYCNFRQGATVYGTTTLAIATANLLTVNGTFSANSYSYLSSTNVNGTLTLQQGIVFSYTSLPSLGANSLGFVGKGNFNNYSVSNANQMVNIMSTSLNAGVYFIELYAVTSALTTAGTSVSLSITTISGSLSLSNMETRVSTLASQSIVLRTSGMVPIQNNNTNVYFVASSSQAGATFTGGFQFTRIA